MRFVCLFCLFFFAFGCNGELNEESVEQIDIDTSRKYVQTQNIDCVISEIDIIKLESNDKCIIDRSTKLIVHGSLFYILDQSQHVVNIFNEKGDLVSSTKNLQGRGPDEYLSLTDFIVSNDAGDIEFIDPRQFKIFEYSINGKIEKQIKLNPNILPLSHFFKLDDDKYLFYSGSGYNNGKHLILYSISKERVDNSFLKVNDQSSLMGITTTCPFSYLNGDVLINHLFPSNITYRFNIEKHQMTTERILNIDKNTFNLEDLPPNLEKEKLRRFMPDNNNRLKFVLGMVENSKYLIVSYYYKSKVYTIFYNKELGDYYVYTNEPGMLNQIPLMKYCDEKYVYYVSEPMDLKYYVNTSLMAQSSINLMNEVDINDNPVIIRYKLK